MYLTNENDHEYRFGTHGPKYLTTGPNVDMGVVVITPGEKHPCHKHVKQEESGMFHKVVISDDLRTSIKTMLQSETVGNLDFIERLIVKINDPFTFYAPEMLMLAPSGIVSFRITRTFDNGRLTHFIQRQQRSIHRI